MGEISQPVPICEDYQLDAFESGESTLDEWLKRRVLANKQNGASRMFVVHDCNKVIAYYALATGSVVAQNAPGKIRRNMPNPIPVMVLGRLAIDKAWQGQKLGRGLLKDAVLRTLKVSRDTGIRALLAHTLSESAQHFYKRYGFIESPLEPMTLMLAIH